MYYKCSTHGPSFTLKPYEASSGISAIYIVDTSVVSEASFGTLCSIVGDLVFIDSTLGSFEKPDLELPCITEDVAQLLT